MSVFSRRIASLFSSGVLINPTTGRLSLFGPTPLATVQSVAYASAITPDPTLGEVISVAPLSGDITVNNPSSATVGQLLEFNFLQDATGGRRVSFGSHYQLGGAAQIALTASARSMVRFRCLSSTFWALQTGLADTSLQMEAGVWKGALPTETPGTTKVPRFYLRTGMGLKVTKLWLDLDTAPTGTCTVVVRKNGSSTGALTISATAGQSSVSLDVTTMTLALSDYVQAWVTSAGGATDAVATLVGVVS